MRTRVLAALAAATAVTLVAWQTGDWWRFADTPRTAGDTWRAAGPGEQGNLTVARVLLFAAVFGFAYALPGWVRRTTRVGAIVFAAWTALLGLWLLATWPGILTPDTVDVTVLSREGIVYSWFSWLYSVANLALLDVVPHAAVWAPIQIGLTAGVMAWASQLTYAHRPSPWPVATMNVVAALSVPVIVNALAYGRDTVFALLHIVLALLVAQAVARRRWPAPGPLAGIAALVAVLSVLRGDGVVLVLVVPLVLLAARPDRRQLGRGALTLAGMLILVRIVAPLPLSIDGRDEIYGFALRVNPLSLVLQTPFHSDDLERDLSELSRVIDVQKARELGRPAEMELYYSPFWRRDASDADFAAFTRAADRILLANPVTTLAARLETFGAATGLAPGGFTFAESAIVDVSERYTKLRGNAEYLGGDLTGLQAPRPPVERLYNLQADLLRPTTVYSGLEARGTALHWNFLPWMALLVVALALWRRAPFEAAFAAVLLSRVPLVFVAAPSAQFKYYYSVHLGGILMLGFLAARARGDVLLGLLPRAVREREGADRVARFALVSGTGLLLDYAIYASLCSAGVAPTFANLISASAAVTFVYLVSGRHIFRAAGDLRRLFAAYALFQLAAVPLASLAVGAATELFGDRELLGKTLVVPFSFTANYLFTSRLLSGRYARTRPA